ncbi:MAG: amino acid adenylation domain-containing protein [Eubacteriales bacterium]|nr:amino acid adenylation domain-containing protein [Eubacteriales bacterium]
MSHNVIELLSAAASAYPDKPALIDQTEEITFSELYRRAKVIGSYIAGQHFYRRPVIVLVDRDAASVVSFLGIACSGCFYVPVDVQMPMSRMETILHTFRGTGIAVLAQKKQERIASQLDSEQVSVWYLEDIMETQAQDDLMASICASTLDVDPLYMIFTSGSTGVPKGVIKNHRSIISFIREFTSTFGITSEDVLGGQAPFDFDVSAKDIYTMLSVGATLVIFPKTYFSFTKKLVDAMNEYRVTTIIWAVSALSVVVKMNALEHDNLHYLKRVLFSGEILPIPHLNYWRRYLPDVMYVNLYAPTEVTGNCTYYIVDREFSEQETLPLGRCFPNIEMLVLKEDHSPVLPGETGRIYIRGAFLSMGYYANPEKTCAAFIQNPTQDAYPDIVYDTGDLAQCLPEGGYRFLSRQDFQIKHHGHRIELGEIETAANALEAVRASAAIYDKEHQRIVLFAEGEELSVRYLLGGLRRALPKYMLPEKTVILEEIPLNKNMKIDRQLLLTQAEALD